MKKRLALNPIQRFKQGKKIQVPKFQTPWKTLTLQSADQRQQALEDFSRRAVNTAKETVKPVVQSTQKAVKRNKDIAALQLQLWNSGAFEGVIDKRTGKQVTYDRAVDGLMGRMTNEAKLNSQKKRENIQITHRNKPIEQKNNIQQTNGLASMYQMSHASQTGGFRNYNPSSEITLDSKNEGLQAILDHKRRFNIQSNSGILDKNSNTFNIYKGDSLIASYPITSGLNKGDGMASLSAKYLSESPRTTGAGVFTIQTQETSPYMGKEPLFRMIPDSLGGLSQALHSPSGMGRIQAIKNKQGSTYGCINGLCGVAKEIYDKKLLTDKDTIYVLPEIEGNKLIEKNGKLQMEWGNNNPNTYTDSKGKIQQFRYNNKK